MGRKKVLKSDKLLNNIQWDDDGTQGRLRFKFLGLEERFVSLKKSKQNIIEYTKRVAIDIKFLETSPNDRETNHPAKYPFTNYQLQLIEDAGHKLLPEIRAAFYKGATFRQVHAIWTASFQDIQIRDCHMSLIPFADKDMNDILVDEVVAVFSDIRTWKQFTRSGKMRDVKVSVSYQHQKQNHVRAVFKFAKDNGLMVSNPFENHAKKIKKVTVPKPSGKKTYNSDSFWTPLQQEIVYDAAAQVDHMFRTGEGMTGNNCKVNFDNVELLVRMGMFTGARAGDLCNMRWSEFKFVDSHKCRWYFKQSKHMYRHDYDDATEGTVYNVLIDDFAQDPILIAMIREAHANRRSDFVFETLEPKAGKNRNEAGPLPYPSAVNHMRRVIALANENVFMKKMEVEEIHGTMHKMRHTMVANVISWTKGMWDVAQNRCGHKTVDVTIQMYGGMFKEEIDNALAIKNTRMLEARAKIRESFTPAKVLTGNFKRQR